MVRIKMDIEVRARPARDLPEGMLDQMELQDLRACAAEALTQFLNTSHNEDEREDFADVLVNEFTYTSDYCVDSASFDFVESKQPVSVNDDGTLVMPLSLIMEFEMDVDSDDVENADNDDEAVMIVEASLDIDGIKRQLSAVVCGLLSNDDSMDAGAYPDTSIDRVSASAAITQEFQDASKLVFLPVNIVVMNAEPECVPTP